MDAGVERYIPDLKPLFCQRLIFYNKTMKNPADQSYKNMLILEFHSRLPTNEMLIQVKFTSVSPYLERKQTLLKI